MTHITGNAVAVRIWVFQVLAGCQESDFYTLEKDADATLYLFIKYVYNYNNSFFKL